MDKHDILQPCLLPRHRLYLYTGPISLEEIETSRSRDAFLLQCSNKSTIHHLFFLSSDTGGTQPPTGFLPFFTWTTYLERCLPKLQSINHTQKASPPQSHSLDNIIAVI
ncbi:hypothetical protein OCU04_006145 [Sclerotinia nivalis]|uniref:Uncharacterized protein n=1 Tax=Sclerotinia nivalis TaxID=352851 RepID=A0A9X0DK92_9HELO|nr:hypothetical protein OCU04_006145 [Sclerotinia nivalis]